MKAKEPIGNFQALETVKENMEGYSKQQIAGAKAARDSYRHFQCPGYEAFKALLKMNTVQDCPVAIQDADSAQKIFGPDVVHYAKSRKLLSVVKVKIMRVRKLRKLTCCLLLRLGCLW